MSAAKTKKVNAFKRRLRRVGSPETTIEILCFIRLVPQGGEKPLALSEMPAGARIQWGGREWEVYDA